MNQHMCCVSQMSGKPGGPLSLPTNASQKSSALGGATATATGFGAKGGLAVAAKDFSKTIETFKCTEDYILGQQDKKSTATTGVGTSKTQVDPNDIYVEAYFLHTYNFQQEFKKKITPFEVSESFDKQMEEIKTTAKRSISHTLNILAGEISHGQSILNEANAQLEKFMSYKENQKKPHSFPSPFFSQFISDLDRKSKSINESISIFERSFEDDDDKQSTDSFIQLIQSQHDAIIRCAAKLSKVKNNTEQLRNTVVSVLKKQGITYNDAYHEASHDINNDLDVIQAYQDYLNERKRNLEKRDKTTKFEELCKPAATTTANKFGNTFGNKTGTSTGGGFGTKTTGFGTSTAKTAPTTTTTGNTTTTKI